MKKELNLSEISWGFVIRSEPCLMSMLSINYFVFPISLLINFHILFGLYIADATNFPLPSFWLPLLLFCRLFDISLYNATIYLIEKLFF
jgi:hypothetical protein